MKILKITTAYPAYLNKFYARHPHLASKPYEEQKVKLDYDAFGWSNFWSHALAPLDYEMVEVLANAEPLQKSWALENNIEFKSTWLWDVAFEQVIKFKPTILFMDDYSTFTYLWLKDIRQACSSIRLVISWCGAPYENETVFKAHDLVLSCIPELVEQFRAMNHLSEHVNHAFDPRLLDRIDVISKPELDFSFIGQIVRGNQYHSERELILEKLVSQVPIQIYSPGTMTTWKTRLKLLAQNSLYETMKVLKIVGVPQTLLEKLPKIGKFALPTNQPMSPISPLLRRYVKPGVFGLEMFQILRNSKIAFNSHINISPRSASNMRLFEATGVGTCLVTDWKENLASLFELDREVVAYKSAEDCIEKVKWLLEHPQEREAIAQAGQARTLKDHTFAQRAIQLDEIIKKQLA
jgi:hypothetical protein